MRKPYVKDKEMYEVKVVVTGKVLKSLRKKAKLWGFKTVEEYVVKELSKA